MTKRLLFGRDIKAQPKTNPPPGRFVPPPELLLKVDAQTRSEIDNLVATASLENPTQHILEVAIVGPHPFLFWPEEPVFRFEPHKKKVDGPIIQRIDAVRFVFNSIYAGRGAETGSSARRAARAQVEGRLFL